ncbi:MAG TPA: HAD-IIB family hydrolase [Candidatus Saccharimonadales bacterium]|jgi:hypothetical protein
MPEIKLVLTDLDGTVVQLGDHAVSERVRDSIIACEDADVTVAPVTGRPHRFAQPILEVLGFDGLGVFDNGATIQDIKSGMVHHKQWLEPEKVQAVATILYKHARVIYYEPGLYEPGIEEHAPGEYEAERIAAVQEDASHIFAQVYSEHIAEISAQLRLIPGISFYTAPSSRNFTDCNGIQVTHELADKFHGVEALRVITGSSKEQTLAIGDGDNDIPFFRSAGLKIAMGNASDELKALADDVVADIDHDGFAEAMERFVLSVQ